MSILPVLPVLAEHAPTILLTTGTVTSAEAAGAAAGAGAGRPRAAPVRAARCAALGGAVSRSLAAGCGRVRRERAMAEPARRVPRAAHPDDADQRTIVRAQPRTVAACAGAGASGAGRVRAGAAAQRDGRREAARSWLLPRGRAGRSEARRAAAAGRRDGTAAAAGDAGRAAGLARRQHPSRRGDAGPRRPSHARGGSSGVADDHRPASPGTWRRHPRGGPPFAR